MALEKFEEKVITEKLKKFFGKGKIEFLDTLSKATLGTLISKMIRSWVDQQKKEKIFEIAEKMLAMEEGLSGNSWWDAKKEIEKIMESKLIDVTVRLEAIKWLTVLQAGEIAKERYLDKVEAFGGVWLMSQVMEKDDSLKIMDQVIEENKKIYDTKKLEILSLESVIGGLDLTDRYSLETVAGTKCFYKKNDEHKFNPVLAAFPALMVEDIEKIKANMPLGIPKAYEKFLLLANGLRIGWMYNWWGVRRIYDEIKHLEQNYSLINSRCDEQLLALIGSTEMIFGSDRYRNIFVMDIGTDKIAGIIRVNGDELAMPERKSFGSLGELLSWQLENAEKMEKN